MLDPGAIVFRPMRLQYKAAWLIAGILIADQIVKIIIKTNMHLGESIPVLGDWFIIHFIENKGMAFGMTFGGDLGKILLTSFRIVAVTGLLFFIRAMIKKGAPTGFILALAMITAGAAGNIIDSMFYGMIFSESGYPNPMTQQTGVATFLPEGGGYSSFFHGSVVDWIYFPVIKGNWPDWFPGKAGQSFIFFRPVFNLADSAITIGVFWILLFQRKFLKTV